jgi:hypothetical protein
MSTLTPQVLSALSLLAAGVPIEKAGEYTVRIYDWPRGKLLHTNSPA